MVENSYIRGTSTFPGCARHLRLKHNLSFY
jgi:hypothetical protein